MLQDFELLARLVAFDTTSRNSNLPLADFVAEYVDGAGARVERNPAADGTKCNLVVRFGPEEAGDRAGLVLSGHMDVVPAEEPEWRSDPFALTDGGDRFFARGACDMKGFLAVAINVAAGARDLAAPLVLVLTYDEELGTLGAHHLVESYAAVGSLPRNAIIGEPTELRVVRMHKGHLAARVTVHGRSAHSGYPHLGDNAIDKAGAVLAALGRLRHALEQERGPNVELFPEVPYVPMNVGTIRGGAAVNVVPDRCVIGLGARLLPGMTSGPLLARLREAVAPHELELLNESPPLLLDREAPVHEALRGIVGQTAEASVSYATDGGWLATAGLDCAIFGPGSITVAHKPNEYVPKADLTEARRVLEHAVDRFCRGAT